MWGCFAGETRKTPPHLPFAPRNPKEPRFFTRSPSEIDCFPIPCAEMRTAHPGPRTPSVSARAKPLPRRNASAVCEEARCSLANNVLGKRMNALVGSCCYANRHCCNCDDGQPINNRLAVEYCLRHGRLSPFKIKPPTPSRERLSSLVSYCCHAPCCVCPSWLYFPIRLLLLSLYKILNTQSIPKTFCGCISILGGISQIAS